MACLAVCPFYGVGFVVFNQMSSGKVREEREMDANADMTPMIGLVLFCGARDLRGAGIGVRERNASLLDVLKTRGFPRGCMWKGGAGIFSR